MPITMQRQMVRNPRSLTSLTNLLLRALRSAVGGIRFQVQQIDFVAPTLSGPDILFE